MRSMLPLMLVVSIALGARGKGAVVNTPTSSAAEIPALAALLEKGKWTPTPELSGRYNVGTIIDLSKGDHRIVARSCFSRAPIVSPYIGAELVASMQAGVAVRAGGGSAAASGELVKKVKFGTPTTESLESLYMKLSSECARLLEDQNPAKLAQMYVVQEVLKAEIAEQSCGRVDARGTFVGLGSAEVEYSQACNQETLEPVVVGYRTLPLVEVLPEGAAKTQTVTALSAKLPASEPATGPVSRPVAETGLDTASLSRPEASGSDVSGGHLGVYLGLQNGVRYQYVLGDGRRTLGLRAEGGLAFTLMRVSGSFSSSSYSYGSSSGDPYSFYTWSPYPHGALMFEYERRFNPAGRFALQANVGVSIPGYVQGGVAAVFGPQVGWRAEVGVGAGVSTIVPRATLGWVW